MRTRRFDALAGRAQHAHNMCLFVAWFATVARVLDHFAREGTIDEDRLAIDASYPSSFVIQRFDSGERHGLVAGPVRQKARL
jgi:hypothetical protein